MLESLYSEAIKKRNSISEKIENFEKYDLNIFKYWNNEKINDFDDIFTIAAGDGSKHEKKFLSFYFYAIAAESLIYTDELSTIESSHIDILSHSKFASDRIRNYMGLFEVKNALKAIKTYDIDYYFYDGSILGDLIRPHPLEKDIPQNIRQKILDLGENLINKEIEDIKNLEVEISSVKIANNILKEKFEEFNDYNPIIYLENIEKLLTLVHLLKYNKKIIAISKTSTANDYFGKDIPDIAIFDKYTKSTGYSEKIEQPVSTTIKHEFPVEDAFFKSLTFTIFYLRLEENKNILKIELPYKAEQEDINNIIRVLSKDSVEGYPYLLKKVHHDVVIKRKDIDQLSKIIGFYEKSGREML